MFKGIKVFFNWLFNDVAPWPTDEDVRQAEEEAAARIAAREEQLYQKTVSKGMTKALRGKAKATPWTHTLQVELTEEELANSETASKKRSAPKKKPAVKKTVKSKTKKRK